MAAEMRKLVLPMLFLTQLGSSSGASLWWHGSSSRHPDISASLAGTRPSTYITPQPSELLDTAVAIISSLQTAPSCHRMVTTSLLGDCSRLNDSHPSGESQRENLKSRYAAALALCELKEAGSAVPEGCDQLASMPDAERSQSHDLQNCLVSLKQEPQSWTSYSNNRKNAYILCEAVRGDIEQDRTIRVFKGVITASEKIRVALSEAIGSYLDQLQHRGDFAERVNDLEKLAFENLQELRDSQESLIAKTLGELKLKADVMSASLDVQSRATVSEIENVNQALKSMSTNITLAFDRIQNVSDSVLAGTTTAAQVQKSEWLTNQKLAKDLRQSLTALSTEVGLSVTDHLKGLQQDLASMSAVQGEVLAAHGILHEKAKHLQNSMDQLAVQGNQLYERQSQQLRRQDELRRQTERLLNSSTAKLARIDKDVSELTKNLEAGLQAFSVLNEWTSLIRGLWNMKLLAGAALLLAWQDRRLVSVSCMLLISVLGLRIVRAAYPTALIRDLDLAEKADARGWVTGGAAVGGIIFTWIVFRHRKIPVRLFFESATGRHGNSSISTAHLSVGSKCQPQLAQSAEEDHAFARRYKHFRKGSAMPRSGRAVSLAPGL